ncbi:PREDICTED: alkaline ceramidase 1 [Chinchilla lanigera]|uniref:Alkaline ceramidase n=1 Tax=Chinchilla lanigera TaxID=34839 RepID=A0A8C2YR16_CHILA|nr:PREDICTED: alkaline ceramidase 1 [Chinchilla lanigera]
MPSILAYQSSEVDWCEGNFLHSPLVAEFYNTFSNVTFLIFGPLMTFLMHSYIQKRSRYIYCTMALFVFTGLFSMYFHATLSFLGQLLDEVAILWMLASSYSIWMPRCYFPTFVKGSRFQFTCMILTGTVIATCLSVVRPTANAYALNSVALHIVYMVRLEYKKTRNMQLRHMIEMSVILWAGALASWISDRLFCSFWQQVNFFYLHSIWHVLISFMFPYGFVTMALVDARYEMPSQTLRVRYWPRDTWPVGLPYVEVQADDKNC